MAPPQLALQLIENGQYLSTAPLDNGQWNSVWRVTGRSGSRYIVKRFRSPWAHNNEVTALGIAKMQRIPVPDIHAISALSIVYPDNGAVACGEINEGLARNCGFWLSRIHQVKDLPKHLHHNPRTTMAGQTLLRARHAGLDLSPNCLVHGDLTPTNALCDTTGRFMYIIDWEEAGLGHPLADLMLTLIEFSCHKPALARNFVEWITLGYFHSHHTSQSFGSWQDRDLRQGLFKAAFATLRGWAEENDKRDLLIRYDDGCAAAEAAIVGQSSVPHV